MAWRHHSPWTLLACAAILSVGGAAAGMELAPEEIDKLAAGARVDRPYSSSGRDSFVGGTSFILIDAPASKVFETAADPTVYPMIFPYVYDAKVTSARGDTRWLTMYVGVSLFKVDLFGVMTVKPKTGEIFGSLDKNRSNFVEDGRTVLRIIPQPGDRSIAMYSFSARPPFTPLVSLLGKEIVHHMEEILLAVPELLKQRVEKKKGTPEKS